MYNYFKTCVRFVLRGERETFQDTNAKLRAAARLKLQKFGRKKMQIRYNLMTPNILER